MGQTNMETRSQASRLDQHDEHISKIQSDILEIKAVMESERVESAEFRKVMLGWMKQQGKLSFSISGEASGVDSEIQPPPLMNTPPIQEKGEGSGITNTWDQPPFQNPPPRQNPPVLHTHLHPQPEVLPWAAKKIKLPEFFGFDPQGWISKAELFFEIHATPLPLRIRLAKLSMAGAAQHWFTIVTEVYEDLTWEQLKQELLQRFSGLDIQNPFEQLATIKQSGTIHDYIDEFEYLLSLVPRLPESQSLGYFIAGLKDDVKRWVRLHRPQSRLDAMYLAKDVESMLNPSTDAFANRFRYQNLSSTGDQTRYDLINSPVGQLDSKAQHAYAFNRPQALKCDPSRSTMGSDRSTPEVKTEMESVEFGRTPFNTDVGVSSQGRNRGFRTLTRSEWEERRRKGLCYKCGQMFGPAHKCPEGALRIMLLADDEGVSEEGLDREGDPTVQVAVSGSTVIPGYMS